VLNLIQKGKIKHLHFKPMISFLSDRDRIIKCNYIHKIEDDINRLHEKLEIGVSPEFANTICESLNKKVMKNFRDEKSIEIAGDAIKLIQDIYHDDFWKFGYTLK
jgi:hypothetical protein